MKKIVPSRCNWPSSAPYYFVCLDFSELQENGIDESKDEELLLPRRRLVLPSEKCSPIATQFCGKRNETNDGPSIMESFSWRLRPILPDMMVD